MKTTDLTIPRHTVVVMCGPTFCGKTSFVEKVFGTDAFKDLNVAVISSDSIRHNLLGNTTPHRHSPQMHAVSKQAFELLFTQLKASVSYPVNADYVVVDTRGAQEEFRKQVLDIAKANGYNTAIVTFEYKNREEYLQYCQTHEERTVVAADLTRYLRKVLPTVRARDWGMRLRITRRDHEVTLVPQALPSCLETYPTGQAIAIIGDSHECVDELKALIAMVEERHGKDVLFVHIGDYLDKGGATIEMMKCMLELGRTGRHVMVRGNHEQYVYRRLKGELEPNPELEATYFTSIAALQADEFSEGLFLSIFEQSLPFAKLSSPGARDIIVTHAPCENKYLGKFSDAAQRAQRNFFFKDREAPVRDALGFIYKEADNNHPLHVFGHVAHRSDNLVYKNKVFLDTGAVHGGSLTAMVMKNNRYEFMQVQCAQRVEKGVDALPDDLTTPPVSERKFNIFDYDLSPQDMRLVRSVMKNGTRYISGTMPPAPSTEESLETLDAALEYFRRKGVQQVVLQPKYMGSRCQMYLFRDKETPSFCVSRNGWVIRNVDGLDELIAKEHEKVFSKVDLQSIVRDGELLPWKALGAGLINGHFVPYGALVGDELTTLFDDFSFRSMKIGENYNPGARLLDLSLYDEALALYAGDAPLEFKPFDILSVDGQAYLGNPWAAFATFNDDDQMTVDLSNQVQIENARQFYSHLTVEKGMEGVVVKPLNRPEGVVPYMKVRNPEYLRLIYGYDYEDREEQLIRQKNISGKAAIAVREHKLAMEMLTANDDRRQELVVKMIAELKKEADIDPRL